MMDVDAMQKQSSNRNHAAHGTCALVEVWHPYICQVLADVLPAWPTGGCAARDSAHVARGIPRTWLARAQAVGGRCSAPTATPLVTTPPAT